MNRMAEVLEEISRAARHHLANPADPAKRDRLLAAVEEAEKALYTQAGDITLDGIPPGPPWEQEEGWDPSWSGTRCPSCGHLHPTTAETVSALSRTCQACGAPLRIYAMEDIWAQADAGPRPTSIFPLEGMDPFAENAIRLTPEAWAIFLRVLTSPPPINPALIRAFKRRQALGIGGGSETTKEISAELALLALGESDARSGNLSAAQDVFRQIRGQGSRVPSHPGEILFNEFMVNGIRTIPGLSAKTILDLVLGQKSVTPPLARKLAATFGTTPAFWLNLQANYDAHQIPNAEALAAMAEVEAMEEISQEVREVRRLRKTRSPAEQAELIAAIAKVAERFPARRPEDLDEIRAVLEALWKKH